MNARPELVKKRIAQGISVPMLAKSLNVDESTIRKVESGVRNPSVPLAYKWAKKIKIPQRQLLPIFFGYRTDIM